MLERLGEQSGTIVRLNQIDHIQRRTIKLTNVEILVLDEADRMLDMGFAPDVKRIVSTLPTKRQTLLFSATISPEIKTLERVGPTRFTRSRTRIIAGLEPIIGVASLVAIRCSDEETMTPCRFRAV